MAFYSKTMTETEQNYPIHDKKLLAIVRVIAEWRPELVELQEGPVQVITDHDALKYFTTKKMLNARQTR